MHHFLFLGFDIFAFDIQVVFYSYFCIRMDFVWPFMFKFVSFLVTMQAQKDMPPNLQCKDKFLVQSVVATPGVTPKDITAEMVINL